MYARHRFTGQNLVTAATGAALAALWVRLSRVLVAVARLPMAAAFERLPDPVARVVRGHLYSGRLRDADLDVLRQSGRNAGVLPLTGEASGDALAGHAADVLAAACWRSRPVVAAFGRSEPPAAPAGGPAGREDFAAAAVALFLSQQFAHLRLTAWSLTLAAPLVLLAAASYPFEPERPLTLALGGLVGLCVAAIGYVLYAANRDELLSRILRTPPGRFTPDRALLGQATALVVPLLVAVALQALGLFRVVLDPLLGLFR